MPRICKDGRIWGQNNKEAEDHLGILTGRTGRNQYIKTGKKGGFQKGNTFGINNRFKKGHKPKWTGAKRPEISGEKHGSWKGGISREPYPFNFNKELKELIRRRDNYTCQKCNAKQNGRALDVHHIDYNKKNLEPKNLISLCKSCNSKVNSNRNYWTKFFFKGDKKCHIAQQEKMQCWMPWGR